MKGTNFVELYSTLGIEIRRYASVGTKPLILDLII